MVENVDRGRRRKRKGTMEPDARKEKARRPKKEQEGDPTRRRSRRILAKKNRAQGRRTAGKK